MLKDWQPPAVARLWIRAVQGSPWWDLIMRSGTVLVVRVVGAGLAFGFNVALARTLGAHGLGIYQISLTFAMIASVIGRVGMDPAILKFGATGHAAADGKQLVDLHRMGMGTAALCCSVVAVCAFVSAPWLAVTLYSDPAVAAPLRLMSVALVPFSMLNLYGELLKAGHHQALSSFVQGVALPSANLLIFFFVAGRIKDADSAAEIYLVSTILICVLSNILWRRTIPKYDRSVSRSIEFRNLLKTALPMYSAAIADIVMTYSDVLILGIFSIPSDVGIYASAARTALLTRFLLLASSSVAAPKFAVLHAANDIEGMSSLGARSTLITAVSSLPVVLIFVLFPETILSVFGPQFEKGAHTLIILSIGQFINAATGPVGYLLSMCGLHGVEGKIAVTGALLSVGLCFALIPVWGIVGAAAASAISTAACNLSCVWVAYSRLGILMLPIPRARRAQSR